MCALAFRCLFNDIGRRSGSREGWAGRTSDGMISLAFEKSSLHVADGRLAPSKKDVSLNLQGKRRSESQHLVPLLPPWLWEGITLLTLSFLICTGVTMTASWLNCPGWQVTESVGTQTCTSEESQVPLRAEIRCRIYEPEHHRLPAKYRKLRDPHEQTLPQKEPPWGTLVSDFCLPGLSENKCLLFKPHMCGAFGQQP